MSISPTDADLIKSTLSATIDTLVTEPSGREPLIAETGLVPLEWNGTISKQMTVLFQNWRRTHAYPGPIGVQRPLSPSEALASWGNRPETSDADYAAIRDNAVAIVALIAPNIQYGFSIPQALAQFSTGATG